MLKMDSITSIFAVYFKRLTHDQLNRVQVPRERNLMFFTPPNRYIVVLIVLIPTAFQTRKDITSKATHDGTVREVVIADSKSATSISSARLIVTFHELAPFRS
jgi:hypothetical protein